MNMDHTQDFDGAKVALFLGSRLVSILRDTHEGLPYAGFWDLPGGGREGNETPETCMSRECMEEIGLEVSRKTIFWAHAFETGSSAKWFFCARLPEAEIGRIVFGDEGQRWTLMRPETFISHPKAVPGLQARLHVSLNAQGLL